MQWIGVRYQCTKPAVRIELGNPCRHSHPCKNLCRWNNTGCCLSVQKNITFFPMRLKLISVVNWTVVKCYLQRHNLHIGPKHFPKLDLILLRCIHNHHWKSCKVDCCHRDRGIHHNRVVQCTYPAIHSTSHNTSLDEKINKSWQHDERMNAMNEHTIWELMSINVFTRYRFKHFCFFGIIFWWNFMNFEKNPICKP